ncbi:MAG: hypothetical protein K8T90_14180 [Planctomycetes bacterium]|nr:hypothetical protein [Planctomycetota bacterium]
MSQSFRSISPTVPHPFPHAAIAAALAVAALTATACKSAPRESGGDVLTAISASSAPQLDGVTDDAAWRDATWLRVTLTGPGGTHDARLAAVVADGRLHLAVRWADATEDRVHKAWKPAGDKWASGPEREDVLAIGFPISGEFTGDMTSPVDCVWDVWHWKSARTDGAGFAMDKTHVNTMTDPGGKRHVEKLADGRSLYIRRPEDAGRTATRTIPAPPLQAAIATAPQFEAQAPDGSAADVRAKGAWKDGWWTVELSRALDTGNADDAAFTGASIPFALAVLDHAEDGDHAVSPRLTLALR